MFKDKQLISVLIPNYNGATDTIECMESLVSQDYALENLEIIIVDNGSCDGSSELLKRHLGKRSDRLRRHMLIEFPQNRGIAAAYNEAYKNISPDSFAVLRLDNDVFLPPHAVSGLAKKLYASESIAIVGCRIVYHNVYKPCGAYFIKWHQAKLLMSYPPNDIECDCIAGCAMLMRSSMLRKLEYFFAPDAFLANEVDLCYRVKRIGGKVIYTPSIEVFHKGARSTSKILEIIKHESLKENFIFFLKYSYGISRISSLVFMGGYALLKCLQGNRVPMSALTAAMKNAIFAAAAPETSGAGQETCPICHATKPTLVTLGHDRAFGNPGTFKIISCRDCGVMYLSPRLSLDEIKKYYYSPHGPSACRAASRWRAYLNNNMYFRWKIHRLDRKLSRFVKGGKLLDVGCGRGEFLYGMSRYNKWELHGIEMDSAMADFVHKEFNIPVYRGIIEKDMPLGAQFDVITLLEVFEHFRDPALALRRLRKILKETGVIMIKMPNPDSFGARIFGKYWAGWMVPQHYFFWPKDVFIKFIKKEGFRELKTEFANDNYSYFLTSLEFALQGLVPKRFLKIFFRLLSAAPFEIIATFFIHIASLIGGSPSLIYFICPNSKPRAGATEG